MILPAVLSVLGKVRVTSEELVLRYLLFKFTRTWNKFMLVL